MSTRCERNLNEQNITSSKVLEGNRQGGERKRTECETALDELTSRCLALRAHMEVPLAVVLPRPTGSGRSASERGVDRCVRPRSVTG